MTTCAWASSGSVPKARVLNDVIDGSDYSLKFGDGPRELVIGDRQYLPDKGWLTS